MNKMNKGWTNSNNISMLSIQAWIAQSIDRGYYIEYTIIQIGLGRACM